MRPIVLEFDAIPPEGYEAWVTLPAEEANKTLAAWGYADLRLASDLEAETRTMRSGSDVFVLGSFRTTIRLACVRCLSEFDLPLAGEFHVDLATAGEEAAPPGAEVELRRADLDVDPWRSQSVDLGETVLEQAVLAAPDYPHCAKECAGLCSRCGSDLNAGPCACPPEGGDPRLAVLAKLKTGK